MARIAVIDDEPANRELLKAILEPMGHEVFCCLGASDGMQTIDEYAPDLAIIDLFMPEVSGAAFVTALRTKAKTQALRVVLYTATVPDAALRDFMSAKRIAGVIVKPCEPADVVRIVTAALAS